MSPLWNWLSFFSDPMTYTGARPDFLPVRYAHATNRLDTKSRTIDELREFVLRAPAARQVGGKWQFGVQLANYQLIMVVRINHVDPVTQRFRIYAKDGNELPPSEIGSIATKEPEAMTEPWTIKDPASYTILYSD